MKELEYAALLHDFGKVYIDLAIFMKSKKLFPKDFENLQLKLDYLYRYVELKSISDEKEIMLNEHHQNHKELIGGIRKRRDEKLKRIQAIKDKITALNEPSIMDVDPGKALHEIIQEIEEMHCNDTNENPMTVIGALETTNLSIKKGSLNAMERHEIESHVMHTYSFVSNIPWPPEYKNIPEIALRHHEKLDGTGYPNGEKGGDILIQARIMAIADIYDALTATDRPYKKSIPHERAVDILRKEATDGKIDKALFEIFTSIDPSKFSQKNA
jgi:HD-GYP domain-containing protein (c-di-GMP phosphodiesterase class II)